jgi:ABC-type phosphate transport system auxiliary subunit
MEHSQIEILQKIADLDIKITIAIATSVVSIIIGLFTIWKYFDEKKDKLLELKKSQLTDFYGPLLSYLNTSQTLYMFLKSNKPKNFVLLPHLLDKEKEIDNQKIELTKSDHELIKEILLIFAKIEKIIIKNSGLVDDKELRFEYIDKNFSDLHYDEMKNLNLLSRMLINSKLLKMAYEGRLENNNYNNKELEKFTFPIKINKRIRDNMNKLHKEINKETLIRKFYKKYIQCNNKQEF